MKEEYASLLLNESFVDKWTNVTEEILDDLPVWLLLSLLILFDQVPRNIFRGTYKKLLIVFLSPFHNDLFNYLIVFSVCTDV